MRHKKQNSNNELRSLDTDVSSLLTSDGQFIVGEYKLMHFFMAFFFLVLFGIGVYDAIARNFTNIDYQSYVFALAIIPAVLILKKVRKGTIYIRINKKGIYELEQLVSTWADLLHVRLTQEERKGIYDVGDRFVLLLEYKRPDQARVLRHKIRLTNTQNKSEEEVLAAVRWFWASYRQAVGLL